MCQQQAVKNSVVTYTFFTAAAQGLSLCRQHSHANSLRNSKRDQESLKRDVELCHQQYLAEHQALQALQTQHHVLGKNLTEQAADTKRVS